MILPTILIILLISLGVTTANLEPGLNYNAYFFGRILSAICGVLAVFFSIALIANILIEI